MPPSKNKVRTFYSMLILRQDADSMRPSGIAFETGSHERLIDRIEGVENKLESLEQGISDIKQLPQMGLVS